MRGVVFFDRDGDGTLDPGEWILPGVPVTLEPVAAAASAPDADGFLAASMPAAPVTLVTGPDGTYDFTGVAPDVYRVVASVSSAGFRYSSDTDGGLDWIVSVQVDGQATARADFAGLGTGHITGRVTERATQRADAAAVITCRWSGFDDVAGTADDADFTVVADADGAFDLPGVPYGRFSCASVDPAGRASSSVSATVLGPAPVRTPLTVEVAGPGGELPTTGGSPLRSLLVALGFLGAGIALTVGARRPSRR